MKKVRISLGEMVTVKVSFPCFSQPLFSTGRKREEKCSVIVTSNICCSPVCSRFSPVSRLSTVFHFHLCRLLMFQVPVRERSSSTLTSPTLCRTSWRKRCCFRIITNVCRSRISLSAPLSSRWLVSTAPDLLPPQTDAWFSAGRGRSPAPSADRHLNAKPKENLRI